MIERIAILTNNEVITLSDLPERIQDTPASRSGFAP